MAFFCQLYENLQMKLMVVSDRETIVFQKKKGFNWCHTDVFLKTACAQTCLIELMGDLGNQGNGLISSRLPSINEQLSALSKLHSISKSCN